MHRARLGLITQLNGCNFWDKTKDRRCRKCSDVETLPHVLDHCMVHSTLYKKRHDAVVSRVKKAATNRWEVMTENQVIGSGNLKPDLVLKKGKDVLILDVAIPFENGLEALADARMRKEIKYQGIAQELHLKGFNAKVEAIIIGALGSWDPTNDRVMKRICSNKYLKLMRKIVVSEVISYSRDVFFEHLGTIPQDSGGR